MPPRVIKTATVDPNSKHNDDAPKFDHHALADADAHAKADRALEVVRELHKRYEAQDQRWHNYSKLIGFICFAGLLLAVLYLQRDAHVLYQVHSTIAASVLPQDITSPSDVLDWLQAFLQKTWVDPACGDGLCESPFEFASYGRFGCRADCGRLSESVENLTTIQVDLHFNFDHPVGSIPATELMSQAQWNLCPENGAPHGRDCYYEEDRIFDRIEGTIQEVIDDVPDGLWTIKVKRDFFHKVQGAVRVRDLVEEQARQYTKIWIAMEAANASHTYEEGVLTDTISLARIPLFDLVNQTLTQEVEDELFTLQAQVLSTAITQADHDVAKAQLELYRTSMYTNLARRGACPALAAYNYGGYNSALGGSLIAADNFYSASIGSGALLIDVSLSPPGGTTLLYNTLLPGGGPTCDSVCVCTKLDEVASAARTARFETMQNNLIARLDRNSGRLGAQKSRKLDLIKEVVENELELYDFIIDLSKGLLPLEDPEHAKLDDVISIYVNGPDAYGEQGQPNIADSLLKRTTIMELDISTTPDDIGLLVERCQARLTEIESIRSAYYGLPAVERVQAFRLANDGSIKAVNYTISEWEGGKDTYNFCSLDTRAPVYEGMCTEAVPYTLTSVDTAPYACSAFSNGTVLTGDDCILQVDRQLDCAAVCECIVGDPIMELVTRGCGEGSYCTCSRCESLIPADQEAQYASIMDAIGTANPSARRLHELVEDQHQTRVKSGKRRLQQLSSDSVNALLDSVNSLRTSQDSLRTQVSVLSNQVAEANQAAEERAADKTLENLMAAARQDILLGQARVEGMLTQIIGKQNQALAAAEQAQAAVQAISDLRDRQEAGVLAVEHALGEQLSAIKQAAQQGLINGAQALVLWKRARRDSESSNKKAILSNSACTTERVETHDFEVDNYEDVSLGTARERLIGLTNRVIAGMLIHTTRMSYDKCDGSRFEKIESNCASGISTSSYGVDPVFVMGSSLFDPDLDNVKSLLTHYNCSDIPAGEQRYNIPDPYAKTESYVNQEPYCTNLFNMRNVPFGFVHHPLEDKTNGFPIWFDINLSEDQAQYWYKYLEEGLMLDVLTKEVTVELVTYNAELRMFSSVFVRFRFTEGGAIAVTYRLHTIRVELYSEPRDFARLCLEIIFAVCVFTTAVYQLRGIHQAWVETRRPLAYFASLWTWIGLASTSLMITSNIVWWTFVLRHIPDFDIDIRYDVYEDLDAQAHILGFEGNGEALDRAYSAFSNLKFLVNTLSWYYALNGINILLVIARILNLMHFQPRLGVVTRSLLLAGPDLLHFTVVAGIVFVGYAMMAHVIFGNVIEKFSSFRQSIDTCFEMLLGEISVNEDLKALTGLQGVAGSLFFWTFELLVFMVLLNFLLAIIVDAFSVVKDNTSESTGLHEELGQIMREKWRAMLGRMLNVHYIPSSRLSNLLKHWAGTELQETKAKVPEDQIRKKIKVLDHDMDEEDLRDVLSEAMHNMMDAPDPDEEGGLDRGSKGGGFFSRKNKLKGATENLSSEELEAAAHWLIERFGQEEDESDEEDVAHEDEKADDEDGEEEEDTQFSEEALQREREALAKALERLADVQKELASSQKELMSGQRALAEQQDKLVQFLESPFDEATAALQAEAEQFGDASTSAGAGLGEDTTFMTGRRTGPLDPDE